MPTPIPAGPYAGFGLPYWLDFDRPRFGVLAGDVSTDVAIVGAGISGIKLAHCLSNHGIHSVVLEGGLVGEGASGRNQGSMNHGASIGYAEAIARFGRENARDLWQLGLDNQQLAEQQLRQFEVRCDYEKLGFTYLARGDFPDGAEEAEKYRKDAALLREDGFRAEYRTEADLRAEGLHPVFIGGMIAPTDAQFHSGRYVAGIASGVARSPHVRLHDQTRVIDIVPDGASAAKVITQFGVVRARHVFLLTNALVAQFVRRFEHDIRAERGQVLVTEPLKDPPCRGSYGAPMAWWREIREPDGRWRLLLGGARKRDEPDSLFRQYDESGSRDTQIEREGFSASEAHQRRLDEQFNLLFPHLRGVRVTHRWGGLQGFTADSVPIIGEFDRTRSIHGMAGFSGRGNTYTDIGAKYLADQVAGKAGDVERKYARLFREVLSPNRTSSRWPATEKE